MRSCTAPLTTYQQYVKPEVYVNVASKLQKNVF